MAHTYVDMGGTLDEGTLAFLRTTGQYPSLELDEVDEGEYLILGPYGQIARFVATHFDTEEIGDTGLAGMIADIHLEDECLLVAERR